MATYFMFGKYSLEGMKGISAGRTAKTLALIKKHGGEFKAGYALLGDVDLVLSGDARYRAGYEVLSRFRQIVGSLVQYCTSSICR